jgi:carbon-monoxide dehydrogenase large subunit
MNATDNDLQMTLAKFAVGQPVPRSEDPKLLRGEGRYTDDVSLPGQLYAVIVRSRYAHGILRAVHTDAAKSMPGVRGVFAGADLDAAGYGPLRCLMPLKNRDGSMMAQPQRMSLASGKVRFVGDPVAFVVAETPAQAKDAAEAVELEIDPLAAVTQASKAAAPDAPLLYDDVPGNRALDYHYGDSAKVAAAFAAAAHTVKLDLANSRVVVSAMEPRAALASFDAAAERFTLHVGSQGVFGLRNQLADDVLKVARNKVRVVTGNVGGSFGMKAQAYPEYTCILHAARVLGAPVKWTDERSESFVSDSHGRDHETTAELALDAEGNFLALRFAIYGNLGAYLTSVGPLMSTLNIVKNSIGVYRTPLIEVSSRSIFTNTSPVGPYRGAGRPEGNYYMERLIDAAADKIGIDRLELRRRNHIGPSQMPWAAPSGMNYDSGEFTALLDKAVALADWHGFEARKAQSAARGRLRGRGLGSFLEVTAPPTKEMGGIRFDAEGTVTIVTGTLDYGQGHATPFAQVLCAQLGVPFDKVRLLQGDSDALIAGGGTGGSKSIMASGAAIVEASAKVVAVGRQIAAVALEAAEADIEFANGRFAIVGTDRSIGILELAAKLRAGLKLPAGVPDTLDVQHVHEAAPSAFPNGCHVAEVEIDPETGIVDVVRYTAVNDFGTVINPMLVAGQLHGGVAQGIGQALLENVCYDAHGSLLTGSYMDYAMPRASDLPFFQSATHDVPARTNILGAKGCGEAGCAGALPSVMNALVDALKPYGIAHIDMPATPQRVWQAIQSSRA